jgi:hypothetical protein
VVISGDPLFVVSIDPRSVETDYPFTEQEDFDKAIGTAAHMLADKPIEFRSTLIAKTGEKNCGGAWRPDFPRPDPSGGTQGGI